MNCSIWGSQHLESFVLSPQRMCVDQHIVRVIIYFSNISRSVKAKVDTGLGGKSSAKIREDVAPLPKGSGVQAVTQIAATNKKELDKRMKIIQVDYFQHH